MWIGTCTVGYVWRRMYRTLRNYTLCTYLRVLLGGQVVIKVLHLGGTCRYLGTYARKSYAWRYIFYASALWTPLE